MHSCVKSNHRGTRQSANLAFGNGHRRYGSYTSPDGLATDDVVCLDELFYSRIRRSRRSDKRLFCAEVIADPVSPCSHVAYLLLMNIRYAKRSLRILRQLSKRGTAWPSTCARAVEQLIAALEHRESADSDVTGPRTQPYVPFVATDSPRPTQSQDSGSLSDVVRHKVARTYSPDSPTVVLSQTSPSSRIQAFSGDNNSIRL